MLLWSIYQFETRESLKLTNIVIMAIVEEPTKSLASKNIAPTKFTESYIGISKVILAIRVLKHGMCHMEGTSDHMSDCNEYFTDVT